MQPPQTLVIGSRGSRLALIQTRLVVEALTATHPGLTVSTKIITTLGDQNLAPIPLDTIGKTWFTAEIEQALISGEIDLAVHSLKDLPPDSPVGLASAPVLERADPRDVLVTDGALSLDNLPVGATVGTDSVRRKAELLNRRPDLVVTSLRGNVETRLRKLKDEPYDAIVVAAAGLKRLNMQHVITEYLDPAEFVPAIGQGVLAAQARVGDERVWRMITAIQHSTTNQAVAAEQQFTQVIGGGCKLPVGCYVQRRGNKAAVFGMAGSLDGRRLDAGSLTGPWTKAPQLAARLAGQLLATGVLAEDGARSLPLAGKHVALTRSAQGSRRWATALHRQGAGIVYIPAVTMAPVVPTPKLVSQLSTITNQDLVVFTSANGVRYWQTTAGRAGVVTTPIQLPPAAVVGPATAAAAKAAGFAIAFQPAQATSAALGKALGPVRYKRIMLLRTTLASSHLATDLRERGASITDVPIYQTIPITTKDPAFGALLRARKINYLVFASPSAVHGFLGRLTPPQHVIALKLPAAAVGPGVAEVLGQTGFMHVITAPQASLDATVDAIVAHAQNLKH